MYMQQLSIGSFVHCHAVGGKENYEILTIENSAIVQYCESYFIVNIFVFV